MSKEVHPLIETIGSHKHPSTQWQSFKEALALAEQMLTDLKSIRDSEDFSVR